MELIGKIIVINNAQKISDKFTKREVVIQTEDQYPQTILVQFTNANCEKLDNFLIGENVKIGINIRGREWIDPKSGEVKYFNSLNGWYIQRDEDSIEDTPKGAIGQKTKSSVDGITSNFAEDHIQSMTNDLYNDTLPF